MTNRELLFILRMRNEASKVLRTAGNDFRKMGSGAKRASGDITKTTAATQGLSTALARVKTAFLGLATAFGGRAIAKLTLDFETSLQTIVGLVGIAQVQVDEWRKSILELGPAVAVGPVELAEAMFFITSAGARGAEALDILTSSARAATAGLGETKDVAFAVVSSINAYGSAAITAAEATDILVKTVREGNLAAADLAGALGQILPTAVAAGVELHEVGAAVAALTRSGLGATEAITSIRGVLVAMNRATEEGVVALKKANLTFRDLRDIIDKEGLLVGLNALRDAVKGDVEALTNILGRVEATNAVLALTGPQAASVARIFESLADSTGALDEAFKAVAETGRVELNSVLSELQGLMIQFGEVVLPPLIDGLKLLLENIKLITVAILLFVGVKVMGALITALLTMNTVLSTSTIAALFRFKVAMGGSVFAVQALTVSLGFLKAAFLFLGPAAIIVGAAVALLALADAFEEVADRTDESFRALKALDALLKDISFERDPFKLATGIAKGREEVKKEFALIQKEFEDFRDEFAPGIISFEPLGSAAADIRLEGLAIEKRLAAVKKNFEAFEALAKSSGGVFALSVGQIEFLVDQLGGRVESTNANIEGLSDAMDEAARSITNFQGRVAALKSTTDPFGSLEALNAFDAEQAAIKELGLELRDFTDLTKTQKEAIQLLTTEIMNVTAAEKLFKDAKKATTEAIKASEQALKDEGAARLKFAKFAEELLTVEIAQRVAFLDGVDETFRSLNAEVRLLGLGAKAHRRMAAVIALENLARVNNVEDIGEQIAALNKLMGTLEAAEGQQKTFSAGITRALRRMGDELEDVAARADAAFTKTFNDLSALITDFVTTGTADIQGFFQSLHETLASEAVKDIFQFIRTGGKSDNLFFGGLVDTLTGLFGGGKDGTTSKPAPTGAAGDAIHVIIENLDILSLPGLPSLLPKVGPGDGPAGKITTGDGSAIVTQELKTGFGKMFETLGNVFTDLKAGFSDILSSVGSAVSSILSALFGGGSTTNSKNSTIFDTLNAIVGIGIGFLPGGAAASAGAGAAAASTNPFLNIGGFRLAKGGIVGQDGEPMRVPRELFTHAPSFEAGGLIGGGVPIIAHRGEAVVPLEGGRSIPVELKRDARDLGTKSQGIILNIIANLQDVEGFRQNADQIGADVARQLQVVMARNT